MTQHADTRAGAPAVSIIVPCFNAAKQLPDLFAALRAQTIALDRVEVVVVDDCSTDDTRDVVRRDGLARLVEAPENIGPYAARNLGIEAASADLLAFTDSDCVPEPTWLEAGLARYAGGTTDLVAGHIIMPLGDRPTAAAMLDCARSLNQEKYVELNFGATANLWVRRGVIEKAGAFNPNIESGGDTEFGQRAVRAGATISYAPEVAIVHEPRSERRELAKKARRIGRGAAQHVYHADGPLRDRPLLWCRPGAYVPQRSIHGRERLEAHGISVTGMLRLRLLATQYLWLTLPTIYGNWKGARAEKRKVRNAPTAPDDRLAEVRP